MLTFSFAVSAPYEARQPLVQPEGPSSGGPGAKAPRHQASLIRVSDFEGCCWWVTLDTWFFDGLACSLIFFQGRSKTAPSCKYCTSYSVAYTFS